MARAKRSTTGVVYQVKVTLRGSKPPIWRRMQVTSETTLAQLHPILQRVMGWEGYHLYRFVVGGESTAIRACWRRWKAKTPGR